MVGCSSSDRGRGSAFEVDARMKARQRGFLKVGPGKTEEILSMCLR